MLVGRKIPYLGWESRRRRRRRDTGLAELCDMSIEANCRGFLVSLDDEETEREKQTGKMQEKINF